VAAVLAELEQEMLEAAGKLEFERAAILRDQIDALKSGAAAAPKSPRRARSGSRYQQSRRK
jgi:excinuclease ABC subunit B